MLLEASFLTLPGSEPAGRVDTPRGRWEGRGTVAVGGGGAGDAREEARPVERARIDLRRTAARREGERVLARARFLEPPDRELVYAVFRDHTPIARLALVSGVSAARLRRRVRSLVARTLSARFEWAMVERDSWSAARRRVGDAYFLQGRSQRAIASRLRVSLAAVRAHLAALRALEEAHMAGLRSLEEGRRAASAAREGGVRCN